MGSNLKTSVQSLIERYGPDKLIKDKFGGIFTLEQYLADIDDRANSLECRMTEDNSLVFQLANNTSGPIFTLMP